MDETRRSVLETYADSVANSANALAVTVTRTRSLAGRDILAFLASGRRYDYRSLVDEVRTVDPSSNSSRTELARAFDSDWLGWLAEVVSRQNLTDGDLGEAISLYEILESQVGRIHMTPQHAKFYADCLMAEGRFSEVQERLWDLPVTPRDRAQLHADLANPFLRSEADGMPVQSWMGLFEEALGHTPSPGRVALQDEARQPFDRLSARGVEYIAGGPLVSVVLTTYRPDETLITAARSILEQSWREVELLVVDDGSPKEHAIWLERVEGLDPRVRVMRLATNGGTYQARNVGLAVATGEFATFQDSDDWSHPHRIEEQVRPMLAEPSLMATTSTCVRADSRLSLTSIGFVLFRLNTSSLMIRLKPVLGRVGFMDRVRKAADSEYLRRVEASFDGGYVHLRQPALSVVRLVPSSLSRQEFGPGWHHPARITYREGYQEWHKQFPDGRSPYVAMNDRTRAFPAPTRFRIKHPGQQALDVVFVSDWRKRMQRPEFVANECSAARQTGAEVGIAHLESYRHVRSKWPRPYRSLLNMASKHKFSAVQLDDPLKVGIVIVTPPEVLQFPSYGEAKWEVGEVRIFVEEVFAGSVGGEVFYNPPECHAAATAIFGVPPVWVAENDRVQASLEGEVPADSLQSLSDGLLPSTVRLPESV